MFAEIDDFLIGTMKHVANRSPDLIYDYNKGMEIMASLYAFNSSFMALTLEEPGNKNSLSNGLISSSKSRARNNGMKSSSLNG